MQVLKTLLAHSDDLPMSTTSFTWTRRNRMGDGRSLQHIRHSKLFRIYSWWRGFIGRYVIGSLEASDAIFQMTMNIEAKTVMFVNPFFIYTTSWRSLHVHIKWTAFIMKLTSHLKRLIWKPMNKNKNKLKRHVNTLLYQYSILHCQVLGWIIHDEGNSLFKYVHTVEKC